MALKPIATHGEGTEIYHGRLFPNKKYRSSLTSSVCPKGLCLWTTSSKSGTTGPWASFESNSRRPSSIGSRPLEPPHMDPKWRCSLRIIGCGGWKVSKARRWWSRLLFQIFILMILILAKSLFLLPWDYLRVIRWRKLKMTKRD